MAISIPMTLLENTEKFAVYEYTRPVYEPDPTKPKRQRVCSYQYGRAQIDKGTGTAKQLSGEDWDNGFYFSRVARVMIRNHLIGSYPEITGYQA